MKKSAIYLIALLLLSAGSLSAQTAFGVKGSFDLFNMTVKDDDGDRVETKMIPTFDAGVFAEIPVADEFYLRPELLFAQKGSRYDNIIETTTRISYLELPINFLYKGALSGGNVLVGFGPYFALGVGGKVKSGNVSLDVKFKNDYTDADELAVYYKPFDMGAKVMAGYELSAGLQIILNASLGIAGIEPSFNGQKPDSSTKNVGFGLSLGYVF
ncbi:Outer membrane protein beta-barrel domain protein [anaerobic digester metagenome]